LDAPDSIAVVKTDGDRGVRLDARIEPDGYTGTVHSFGTGPGDDVLLHVTGRRVPCE
jgi:hypothetical protein